MTSRFRDKYRTVGDLRAAAFKLSQALRGSENHALAAEIHDSICRMIPGPANTTADEVRFMMGDT